MAGMRDFFSSFHSMTLGPTQPDPMTVGTVSSFPGALS
jgi:hypothetical protein